jgi:hypothetical protein
MFSSNSRIFKVIVFWSVWGITFTLLQINGRTYSTGDSVPYRYLPEALLDHGTFLLDAFPQLTNPRYYAVIRNPYGHLISKKPVFPGILEVPVLIIWRSFKESPMNTMERISMGKVTMSIMAALAAACLSISLLGRVRTWLSLAAGIALIAATPFWFTAMDCWPHPVLGFANAASLALLRRRDRLISWGLIGLLQGMAIATRLGAFPVLIIFFLAAILSGSGDPLRRRIVRWISMLVGLAGPLIFLIWYNNHYFGNIMAGGFRNHLKGLLRLPFEGIAGLLFSPAKGLFLYSPLLLWALAGYSWRNRQVSFESRIAAIGFATHLVFWASYADWWGGWAWGPRYLAEVLPFAVFLSTLHFEACLAHSRTSRHAALILTCLLALCSFGIQITGAFFWNGDYHLQFDKGWGKGRHWVWESPYEPVWRLQRLSKQTQGFFY